MITKTGIPAVVINADVSPQEISYLVATDSPVVFSFQRSEGTIDTAASSGSPAITRLTFEAPHSVVDGDQIGIYDALFDTMIQAEVTEISTNVFDTDLEWDARYASDLTYVLSYTQRANYYLECRLKINGIYQRSTMRFTPNTKGRIVADISAYLRSKVAGDKTGDYVNNSDTETGQSGEFNLEYRERYSGDSNSYTEEGNTWYYVFAIRTKEQGSNLHEYVATATQEGKFFNEFVKPIWVVGTPLDIQFWWPPDYDNLSVTIEQYDAGNNLLYKDVIALDNEAKGKLCSVKISRDEMQALTDYLTIEIDEP